jgi:hypothetical protein
MKTFILMILQVTNVLRVIVGLVNGPKLLAVAHEHSGEAGGSAHEKLEWAKNDLQIREKL